MARRKMLEMQAMSKKTDHETHLESPDELAFHESLERHRRANPRFDGDWMVRHTTSMVNELRKTLRGWSNSCTNRGL